MRSLSILVLGFSLLQASPALARKRQKVHVVTVQPSTSATGGEAQPEVKVEREGRLASTDTSPASTSMGTRPKRYITDGRPANGNILISPMIGNFAFTGTEYGVKASVRILDRGFVPALNNSVSVEGEVFKATWRTFWGESQSTLYGVTGRWDFHLHPQWTVYGAAGLIQEHQQTIADIPVEDSNTAVTIQVGGMMVLTDNFRLRAEWDDLHGAARFGAVLAL